MLLAKLSMKVGMFLAEGDAGEEATELIDTIQEFFFQGWMRVLILTGLGLFAVIKGVMLGVGIVQAADDSQARKEKINGLKYMLIGVILVIILYLGANAIIDLIASSAGSGD